MLVAPLISQRDEVIGVIQLINKKRDPSHKLLTKADVEQQVVAVRRAQRGAPRHARGAGRRLARDGDPLRRHPQALRGFVKASVEAIESRDPTTSGHSRRVADLTVALAKVVDGETSGPYAARSFTPEDLRELEYASLLHDFGKIGVREKVLVKAKKLYDERLELVRARFDYVARSIEADVLARKVRAARDGGDRARASRRSTASSPSAARTSTARGRRSARPTSPPSCRAATSQRIEAIAKETYVDLRGDVQPLLDDDEVTCLKVNRGSLTPQEFDEIRSHVSHTFRFLSQIPWGKSLQPRPHHRGRASRAAERHRLPESPPRRGDPGAVEDDERRRHLRRAHGERPPLQEGRPPRASALDILDFSVKDGHLDAELVRIFKDAKIWERVKAS